MKRAFVSHSSLDRRFVRKSLIPFLRRQGVEPWFSTDKIVGGDLWQMKITTGLKSSNLVILVVSKNAADSKWVRAEIMIAQKMNRLVVPLLLDDTASPRHSCATRAGPAHRHAHESATGLPRPDSCDRERGASAGRPGSADRCQEGVAQAATVGGPRTRRTHHGSGRDVARSAGGCGGHGGDRSSEPAPWRRGRSLPSKPSRGAIAVNRSWDDP